MQLLGILSALPWWLIPFLLLCSLALFVRAAYITHRACWRVPLPSAKEMQPCAHEDVPRAIFLRNLPRTSRRDAAILAALAFCDSPAYVHILRGDKVFRLEALAWLFERNIALVQNALTDDPTRCLFSASERQLCAFFWLLSFTSCISLWAKVRAGLLWFPVLFGLKPFMRLLSIGKQFDQTTQLVVHEHVRCSEREKTVVLERMVVDPGVQGRGLGSACLTAALAPQATAPVVLSTQLQRNVEFYSRIGFHVVLERRFGAPGDPFGFRSWWMLRAAPAQVSAGASEGQPR